MIPWEKTDTYWEQKVVPHTKKYTNKKLQIRNKENTETKFKDTEIQNKKYEK